MTQEASSSSSSSLPPPAYRKSIGMDASFAAAMRNMSPPSSPNNSNNNQNSSRGFRKSRQESGGRRRSGVMIPRRVSSSNESISLMDFDKHQNDVESLSNQLGLSCADAGELGEFVKTQRIKEWVKVFRRSDPRYQILNFFNDVAQEGANNMGSQSFNPALISPLLRAFYRASVFTVWRPTSFDAIRRMMLSEGVGKGLDIKGKSAKRGKLSGFVPFLQIHKQEHKKEIRTLSRDSKMRIYFHTLQNRKIVVHELTKVSDEMTTKVKEALEYLALPDSEQEEAKFEWACETKLWDMEDPSIGLIDKFAPHKYGIEISERLFWEGMVIRQSIERKAGSEDDVGRPSEPNFQMMNFGALRKGNQVAMEKATTKQRSSTRISVSTAKTTITNTSSITRPVITQYVDPNETDTNPMSPLNLVMAYEEEDRVMPVVSDFDCFMVGTRGVKYTQEIPEDQFAVLQWCIDQIESILDNKGEDAEAMAGSTWTSRWLQVLKGAALKGFHPTIPPLGFSDPKSHDIMKHAIHRLSKEGAVRHGAECFNYYFPQELDDEFLVISDNLSGQTLPWRYVDKQGLQEILMGKIEMGYTFPVHPKWILCDVGWKDVYDKLMASQRPNVQDALQIWYPPASGIREKIEGIYQRHPNGFVRRNQDDENAMNAASFASGAHHKFDDTDGTAAMDLAELELKYYLTFQRAKRKLRGLIIWKRLLDDKRKERAARLAKEQQQQQQQQAAAQGTTTSPTNGDSTTSIGQDDNKD